MQKGPSRVLSHTARAFFGRSLSAAAYIQPLRLKYQ